MLYGKSSRGYAGWYDDFYYRSFNEFLFIKLLEKQNKKFELESELIVTPFGMYKIDFKVNDAFIEIKSDNYEYTEKLKWLVNKKIITIITYSEIAKNFSKDELQNLKEYAKSNQKYEVFGEQNPMYGMKHSELSKNKIGLKTTQRFADLVFKEKHSAAVKAAITDDFKQNLSEKQHLFQLSKYNKTPKKCKMCGKTFSYVQRKLNFCELCIHDALASGGKNANKKFNENAIAIIKTSIHKLNINKNVYIKNKDKTYLSKLQQDLNIYKDQRWFKKILGVSNMIDVINALYKIKEEEENGNCPNKN